MNITDLHCGERGVVLEVSSPEPLQGRLRSLNIRSGSAIRLLKVSFFKKTFLIQAGGSKIALRKEVAACVSIRKL